MENNYDDSLSYAQNLESQIDLYKEKLEIMNILFTQSQLSLNKRLRLNAIEYELELLRLSATKTVVSAILKSPKLSATKTDTQSDVNMFNNKPIRASEEPKKMTDYPKEIARLLSNIHSYRAYYFIGINGKYVDVKELDRYHSKMFIDILAGKEPR